MGQELQFKSYLAEALKERKVQSKEKSNYLRKELSNIQIHQRIIEKKIVSVLLGHSFDYLKNNIAQKETQFERVISLRSSVKTKANELKLYHRDILNLIVSCEEKVIGFIDKKPEVIEEQLKIAA